MRVVRWMRVKRAAGWCDADMAIVGTRSGVVRRNECTSQRLAHVIGRRSGNRAHEGIQFHRN